MRTEARLYSSIPSAVGAGVVSTDVAPSPAVQFPKPTNHPVPQEVFQGAYGVFNSPQLGRPAELTTGSACPLGASGRYSPAARRLDPEPAWVGTCVSAGCGIGMCGTPGLSSCPANQGRAAANAAAAKTQSCLPC